MEGYLNKKGSGESVFGRRNWKRRWFTLDGQEINYYDDFDRVNGIPTSHKGTFNVKGCETKKLGNIDEKGFEFVVRNSERSLFLATDDEKLMNTWIKALDYAISGAVRGVINYTDFYEVLGLKESESPDASTINRY